MLCFYCLRNKHVRFADQSIAAYNPAMDFSIAIATKIERDGQVVVAGTSSEPRTTLPNRLRYWN
jgi:hypothetical protein